jgi:lysophospholipase L1-like esterase
MFFILRLFFKITLAVFVLALIVIGIQLVKIYLCTKEVNYDLQPWQHVRPGADFKVLFAGDSTAVGTGLVDNSQSTSGLFSRDFPQADVENHSYNGLRLKGLEGILNTLQDKKFDLAVLQIGANDILHLTPMTEIREDQRHVLDLTKHIARKVIILHSGDAGEAPLFIWPFTWIYTWRSLKVREIYMASQDDRVSYIDIYTLNKQSDLSQIYAKDRLHLNTKGYALWYSYIKIQLQKLHWLDLKKND